jgi:uncharacterized membrane protein YbhN (UPF0104 family)
MSDKWKVRLGFYVPLFGFFAAIEFFAWWIATPICVILALFFINAITNAYKLKDPKEVKDIN